MTWLSTCHNAPILETDDGSKCSNCERFCNIHDADMYADPKSQKFIKEVAEQIKKDRLSTCNGGG